MEDLGHELKHLIVEALLLEDVKAEEIDSNAPLFVEGLGLDSIDALELVLAINRKYGVEIKADTEGNKEAFRSVSRRQPSQTTPKASSRSSSRVSPSWWRLMNSSRLARRASSLSDWYCSRDTLIRSTRGVIRATSLARLLKMLAIQPERPVAMPKLRS